MGEGSPALTSEKSLNDVQSRIVMVLTERSLLRTAQQSILVRELVRLPVFPGANKHLTADIFDTANCLFDSTSISAGKTIRSSVDQPEGVGQFPGR